MNEGLHVRVIDFRFAGRSGRVLVSDPDGGTVTLRLAFDHRAGIVVVPSDHVRAWGPPRPTLESLDGHDWVRPAHAGFRQVIWPRLSSEILAPAG